MLQVRTLDTLGGGNRDWLKARHHFAVEAQGNPAHAQLGNLVVWNDDEIAPHSGFPMHGHRDMEIVTYVREGVLQHEDSSGGRGKIGARNVQVITAGRGMRHSEYNDTTRYGYLVPARGRVMVNDQQVGERDGIAIAGEPGIAITAIEPAEIILVDTA
jgi:redox-sensitive bicupin YhaK (pirin superfamily)